LNIVELDSFATGGRKTSRDDALLRARLSRVLFFLARIFNARDERFLVQKLNV